MKVFLEHDDLENKTFKRKPHKLGTDIPFQDVRPPPRVRTLILEAIHTSIRIETFPSRKRKRNAQNQCSDHTILPLPMSTLEYTSSPEYNSEDVLLDDIENESEDFALTTLEIQQSDNLQVVREQQHNSETDKPTDMVLQQDIGDVLRPARIISQKQWPLKFTSDTTKSNVEGGGGCTNTILELIDVGIRTVIGGSPTKTGRRMTVRPSSSARSLANLAPTIWSPGYLKSMSTRAVFLPTINHALNTILNSQCTSERHKMTMETVDCQNRLKANSDMTEAKHHMQTSTERFEGPDITSVHLWRMLENGLRISDAARRLKPLTFSTSQKFGYHATGHDEILDAAIDATGAESSYDSEDEDSSFEELAVEGHDNTRYYLDIAKTAGVRQEECWGLFCDECIVVDEASPICFSVDEASYIDCSLRIAGSNVSGTKSGDTVCDVQNEYDSEDDLLSVCSSLGSISLPDADAVESCALDVNSSCDRQWMDDVESQDMLGI